MTGSSEQKTTTQGTTQPYKNSVPLINTILGDASKAYSQGYGSQPDTSSHVIPYSQQSVQSQKGVMQTANQNAYGANGLNANAQDIIKQGGFNDYQQGALGNMQRQIGQLGQNGLSNAQDDALANYRQTANGNYNPNANPGAQGVLNAALRDQSNAVNLNAAGAGRYGSGMHEGVLAQKAGDLSNSFRYNDFNNWLGRKDSANAGMASLGQQGVQNRQGLSSSIFNAGQAGLGNMTSAYQAQQMPYQAMAGVGSQMEDLATRSMNDRLRIWNETQQAPLKNFQNYLGIAGLNGQFNNTSQTTTAPGQNPFMTALGGVGLLSSFL